MADTTTSPDPDVARSLPATRMGAVVCVVLAFSAVAGRAQNTDATATTTPTNAVAAAPTSGATERRDPFWPVGYPPPEPVPEDVAEKQETIRQSVVDWPELRLAGLTRQADGTYIALIRGLGWISEGELIRCRRKDVEYHWRAEEIGKAGARCTRLRAILPGGIELAPDDAPGEQP